MEPVHCDSTRVIEINFGESFGLDLSLHFGASRVSCSPGPTSRRSCA